MKLQIAIPVIALSFLLGIPTAQGQTWNLQVVDDAGDAGYDSQIVVTSAGIPYIFYKSGGNLMLAWWIPDGGGAGGWQYKQLDSNMYAGYFFEVLLDAQDRFHVAWNKYVSPYTRYGIYDPATGSWVLGPEAVTGTSAYSYVDLALVQIGEELVPVITSLAEDARVSVFQRTPGTGGWTSTQVDAVHYATHGASIAVDSALNLHVSFYENAGDNLMYATKAWDDTTWQVSTVDIAGNVGDYSSIAVDASDNVHIVYYDATNGDLKYATLNP